MPIPEPQFDDLYREIILDHYRRPRNRGELSAPTQQAEGMNPVCGDEIELDLRVTGETIEEIAFRGQGCSISQSSASLLTERVKGRDIAEAERVSAKFKAMMNGDEPDIELGDLEALQGVAKFPVRVKCALLGWKVLEEGLSQAKKGIKEARG
ncbi:MAG: SUF system NifU family Fe-S cluster assembly protein [Dehalococcoidia bacterium]|nr:SUF system NifU family Fe-S cluster assembly protein [Dehalococcoidia bacterium]